MKYKSFSAKFRLSRLIYYLQAIVAIYKRIGTAGCFKLIRQFVIFKKTKTVYFPKYHLTFKFLTLLDLLTLKEVVLDEEYESRGVNIDRGDRVIIDIGAGFGDFSILCAKKYPRSKIFAFEPDRKYYQLLLDNIRQNKVSNVQGINLAVSSLQEIFSSTRINWCDFLKIDCEGCEFDLINPKNKDYLKKINKISMEYHKCGMNDLSVLERILENSGFSIKTVTTLVKAGIGLLYAKRE